jgi:hypothetical protein
MKTQTGVKAGALVEANNTQVQAQVGVLAIQGQQQGQQQGGHH